MDINLGVPITFAAIMVWVLTLFGGYSIGKDAIEEDCQTIGYTRINDTVYQCSIAGEKE